MLQNLLEVGQQLGQKLFKCMLVSQSYFYSSWRPLANTSWLVIIFVSTSWGFNLVNNISWMEDFSGMNSAGGLPIGLTFV